MPVYHHLDTVSREKIEQRAPIRESFPPSDCGRERRMVNEKDPEQALSAGQIEEIGQPGHLYGSKTSCGEKWRGRARGRYSNQNSVPSHTYTWKERLVACLLFSELQSRIGGHVRRP